MKRAYLLMLLCCISNINIFSAQKKESITQKQNRETLEHIRFWDQQELQQKEKERKAREEAWRENSNQIAALKKAHETESAMYQQKIADLTMQLEAKNLEISRLKSGKQS